MTKKLEKLSILIILFAIGFLSHAQRSFGSVEETLDKLNQISSKERQPLLESEARKEGKVIFYATFNAVAYS